MAPNRGDAHGLYIPASSPEAAGELFASGARWKCLSPEVKSNLRPKAGLGRAQLKQRPCEFPDAASCNPATPSTAVPSRTGGVSAETRSVTPRSVTPRAGSSCAAAGSGSYFRQPPARFRRRQCGVGVSQNIVDIATARASSVPSEEGWGPRSWSTEPAGCAIPAGRSQASRGAAHRGGRLHMEQAVGRASTAMGMRRDLPDIETPEPGFRAQSRAAGNIVNGLGSDDENQLSARRPGELEPLQAIASGFESVRSVGLELRGDSYQSEDNFSGRIVTASEGARQRHLTRSYEAFAQEAAGELVPEASATDYDGHAFSDTWHTSGEDGYRSAMLHAAIRVCELQQGTGLGSKDFIPTILQGPSGPEGLVFQGSKFASDPVMCAPELVRLHTACLLFSELCMVPSPLQHALCFVLRELCQCIFDGFRPGENLLQLTPYFVSSIQATNDAAEDQQRAETADRERNETLEKLAALQAEFEHAKEEMRVAKEAAEAHRSTFESLTSERNTLKEEIEFLHQVSAIRSDELRELGKEFDLIQGEAYTAKRQLEQSKKAELGMASVSKEQKGLIVQLEGRVHDLQLALQLAQDALASKKNKGEQPPVRASPPQLTPELNEELAMRQHQEGVEDHHGDGASSPCRSKARSAHTSSGPGADGHDSERQLKMPLPDGGYQMVIRGSGGEDCPHHQPGKRAAGPTLIVSGEAFSALSIALSLPRPPNPLHFKSSDDEDIVREVKREVNILANEHGTLIGMAREMRQELKKAMKLCSEWNRDELRGLLQSVLVLDPDEAILVPSPVVGATTLVGLGEDEKVPAFLRYDGLLKLIPMDRRAATGHCNEIWCMKTMRDMDMLREGYDVVDMANFLGDAYAPSVGHKRLAQMEHMYNLLLSLRAATSLHKEKVEDVQALQPPTVGVTVTSPTISAPTAADAGSRAKRETSAHSAHHLGAKQVRPTGGKRLSGRPTTVSGGTAAAVVPGAVEQDQQHEDSSDNIRESAGAKPKCKHLPDLSFHASSEILYRSLLGELHEDFHHDQTSMLVAFVHALASFSERLAPSHWSPPPGTPREIEPAVIGLAEFSAAMRLFFPGKPREHLSALKQLLLEEVQRESNADQSALAFEDEADDDDTPATGARRKRGAMTQKDLRTAEWGKRRNTVKDNYSLANDTSAFRAPTCIDLGKILGVRLWRGQVVHPENILSDLLAEPSDFVLELRRQHVVECLMFMDRLQKALRASVAHGVATSESGAPMVNVKQADHALASADHRLTDDQRYVYVLRGFGHRLPDPPAVDHGAHDTSHGAALQSPQSFHRSENMTEERCTEDACNRAKVFYKTRKLLKDHVSRLLEEDESVPSDVFVKRLSNRGVAKCSHMWQPEITIKQVVTESGLNIVRPTTAAAPLEELLGSGGGTAAASSGGNVADDGSPASAEGYQANVDAQESEIIEVVDRYHAHAVAGKDIQELSIGYTQLGLLHWLACPS